MELYLNKSFYGSQSYGVEAAASSYFHIPASKLDLAQAAVIAGLPQAPTEWNPVLHPEGAKLRQTEVLQAMVRSNYISQEDMDKALTEKLVYQAPVNSFLAPHFVDYVLAELRQIGYQPGVQQLNVKTTLDWGKQQIGESIVSSNLAANLWRDGGDSSPRASSPRTRRQARSWSWSAHRVTTHPEGSKTSPRSRATWARP